MRASLVEVRLQPLDRLQSASLVGNLFTVDALPAALRDQILDAVEGNPFFVEEIIRELIDRQAVVRHSTGWTAHQDAFALTIPGALRGVLLARIDHLTASIRQTPRTASVIGREFSLRLLEQVNTGGPGTRVLTERLIELESLGYLRLAQTSPEVAFTFRHALPREAAFQSLLKSEVRGLHQAVGEAMERLYADRLDMAAPTIALPFYQAGSADRALAYYRRAAEGAAQRYAVSEAVGYYSHALDMTPAATEETVLLHQARGLLLDTLGDYERARQDLEHALRVAQKLEAVSLQVQAQLDLGMIWATRDYGQTGAYYTSALELARTMGDPRELGQTLNRVGDFHLNIYQLERAREFPEEALALFEATGDRRGLASTLDFLGITQAILGNLPAVLAIIRRVVALFRELDERQGPASSFTTLGLTMLNYETEAVAPAATSGEAVAAAEEALELCRSKLWRAGEAYALFMLSECYAAVGRFGLALAARQAALTVSLEIDHP